MGAATLRDPEAIATDHLTSSGLQIGEGNRERPSSSKFLIYSEYFSLNGRPFSLLPDPNFLFWSTVHARAYAMLEYGLATFAPITVITGEIGAGKTTLVRHLLRAAGPDLCMGLISNAHGERGQLLHWILSTLNQSVERRTPYVDRFYQFEAFLHMQQASGRRVILIFDEAQNLSAKMLEELRCLSNLNGENDELLQIILVGQPEFNDLIGRPGMRQFAQRVAAQFHLSGMHVAAVGEYIAHRLNVAGAKREIFSPAACELVASESRGLPRVINHICDYALVYAFAEERTSIDADLVRAVIAGRKTQSLNISSTPFG